MKNDEYQPTKLRYRFDAILDEFLAKMAAVPCPLEEYVIALRNARDEIGGTITAGRAALRDSRQDPRQEKGNVRRSG